jgi:thioredoxin-related protein
LQPSSSYRLPTIWFFDANGKQIAPLPGYSPPEDFKPVLTFITSGSYAKGIQFADYLKTLK